MKPKNFQKSKAKQPGSAGFPKIQPLVAGIDVGSEEHYVCAPTSDGGTEMRVFGATTPDLLEMAAWFQQLGVVSVALESTGVYWIPASEKKFVKHLRLAPRQSITGGKPQRKGKGKKGVTRAGQALRTAATTAHHSNSAIGAYYRRLAANKGSDVAVFATARKLACLIYRMLRWGQAYVDEGAALYERAYQAARIQRLKATANQLGFKLEPQTTAA